MEDNMQQATTGENTDNVLNNNEVEVNDINADDAVAGSTHLNEAIAEENALQKLQLEVDEQKDKYLRLFAEFDNFKRRTAKDRIDLIKTAGQEILTSMLDILDDCDRTDKVIAAGADLQAVKEGVNLVFHKLRTTLEAKGLQAMESVGKEFNADFHEAITEIPAPTDDLKGKVLDEVQKGYQLGNRIIRYAKVVVGN